MRWPLAAYVPVAVAIGSGRRRLGLPVPVTLPVVSAAPLVVAAAVPPGKWRYAAVWATYLWVFKVAHESPYDRPERLRERLHVRYPIRLDSLLGGGVPPTLRLQRALRDPPRLTALDKALTAAYGSWAVPHLILGWLLLRHEQHFARAAGRLAAAYHLTTIGYWLVPTAPPWWASEAAGEMNGEVERVIRHVGRTLRGRPLDEEDHTAGNPWASMPSDHVSSAVITAIGLAEVNAVYGVLGWTYAALASFAVVYLGEHYIVDVVAGLAIAEGVRRADPMVSPLVQGAISTARRLARLAT